MSDRVPVAVCPEHGPIYGDELEYNFPEPSKCEKCGSTVNKTMMATPERIEEAQNV